MDSNGIQPVMPVGGAGDFGGNSYIWIILLFFLFSMGGFGGFGWGGNGGVATNSEVQRGFDEQNNMANQREILSAVNAGTAQTVNAVNGTFHDTVNALSDKYSELARDVSNVQLAVQQGIANENSCCCATKQLIQETSANTNAQIAQSKYDTSMQMAQMEQRITAKMDANEIQSLRDQVQQLQLANATQNVLRYPNQWTYNGGYFPPISGCPCGGNI